MLGGHAATTIFDHPLRFRCDGVTRKTYGVEATVEDGRGASALLAAMRMARTLNTMSTTEANKGGVDEAERRLHFRADIGKTNLSLPAARADWFRLESIDLHNGEPGGVGVVTQWDFPVVGAAVFTPENIQRVQTVIRSARWREDSQSKKEPWVGFAFGQALGWSMKHSATKRDVIQLIGQGIAEGWLKRVTGKDAKSNPRIYIEAPISPPDAGGEEK